MAYAAVLKEEFINELPNEKENDDGNNDDDVRSIFDACDGGSKTKMVGLSDQFSETKDRLLVGKDRVFSLCGLAGIGKTALAAKIYNDPAIVKDFGFRAWVNVGSDYQLDEIVKQIRAQVNFDRDYWMHRFVLDNVFSRELSCTALLKKAGKKIAENCDGLPLTIVTIAALLSKTDISLELWENVTAGENSVFTNAYDQISKYFEIPCAKLIKLWSAEGLLEPIKLGTLNEFAWKYLKALLSTSLVLVYLAVTYNGNLPHSISKLWNLQFLIVHTNLNIRPFRVRSFLPNEIWDMKELKHIQVTGSDLPDPCGMFLPNTFRRCTENVLKGLPIGI
ncbi:NBS-coding resistance gene protein [Striga asiatica]|uniref:NBS-coding resistance gene protein n=1 Tax=Striga asiatica TaxID=4170 RepID=A0A5A7R471_STRAF|nr:NBS-coding resistance gene protein [Striga asiatica]